MSDGNGHRHSFHFHECFPLLNKHRLAFPKAELLSSCANYERPVTTWQQAREGLGTPLL